MSDIYYECDQQACGEKCSYPICRHTKDISHAVNFAKGSYHGKPYYFENIDVKGEKKDDKIQR